MKIADIKRIAKQSDHGPWEAEFLETANPETVLALINRIEQMTLSLKTITVGRWDYKDRARQAIKLYGVDTELECPKK